MKLKESDRVPYGPMQEFQESVFAAIPPNMRMYCERRIHTLMCSRMNTIKVARGVEQAMGYTAFSENEKYPEYEADAFANMWRDTEFVTRRVEGRTITTKNLRKLLTSP